MKKQSQTVRLAFLVGLEIFVIRDQRTAFWSR